jgi:phage tail tape-measure protein
MKLEVLLTAVDRLSAPLQNVQRRLDGLTTPIRRIAAATANLGNAAGLDRLAAAASRAGSALGQVAGRVGIATGAATAAAVGFNAIFIRGAADMERFRVMLGRIEGGAENAERVLGRLRDFADATPFNDAGVVESYIRLRDMNVSDPFAALRDLGDAAAGRFTDVTDAVEAFGAALRGEFDPLERFGIQTRIVGENIEATWITATGRSMKLIERQSDRVRVAAGLLGALRSRYEGSTRDMSRTWYGMTSNLEAAWRRLATQVMDAGVFDWLKGRLDRLLGVSDRLQRDGSAASWAQRTSAAMVQAFERMERFLFGQESVPGLFERLGNVMRGVGDVFERFRAILRPVLGDFDALDAALVALAAVTFAPLITALTVLGVALATTPAGAALAAISALAVAGLTIRRNWDGIAEWFGEQMATIQNALKSASEAIERFLGLQRQVTPEAERTGPRIQGPDGPGRILRRMGFGEPSGAMDGAGAAGREARIGGTIQVEVRDDRVNVRARSATPGVQIDVDQGLLVGSA